MTISSSFESWAEVLNPALLPIPGHSGEGLEASSHQHCVSVRVWYSACPAVMWRCQPISVASYTSSLHCAMLQRMWCDDTILLVYDIVCFRCVAPHEICHWAICRCPGGVTCSLSCEWLSHQVPGPLIRIPSPAGSEVIQASTQQWPILGMGSTIIRQIREDTGRLSVRMVNLCPSLCTQASSDQHSWKKTSSDHH